MACWTVACTQKVESPVLSMTHVALATMWTMASRRKSLSLAHLVIYSPVCLCDLVALAAAWPMASKREPEIDYIWEQAKLPGLLIRYPQSPKDIT